MLLKIVFHAYQKTSDATALKYFPATSYPFIKHLMFWRVFLNLDRMVSDSKLLRGCGALEVKNR